MNTEKITKNIINNLLYQLYYDVEPCPACNSKKTGRFVKFHGEEGTTWIINESLRHGELVHPLPEIPFNNLFCADCGNEWNGNVKLKLYSKNKIAQEKKARGTEEILMHNYAVIREKEKEYQSKHRILGKIKKIIGPI